MCLLTLNHFFHNLSSLTLSIDYVTVHIYISPCRWSSLLTCVRGWLSSTSRSLEAVSRASVSTRSSRQSDQMWMLRDQTFSNCRVHLYSHQCFRGWVFALHKFLMHPCSLYVVCDVVACSYLLFISLSLSLSSLSPFSPLSCTGEFHLRLRHLEQSLLQALNEVKGRILDDDR